MQFHNYSKIKIPYLIIIALSLSIFSCGSYQYVGHESDGIYNSSEREVEYVEAEVISTENSSNTYYKNYFKEKSLEYDEMAQEEEIFTDIDSYENEDYKEENDTLRNEYEGYAGWGQDNDNVTINIYSGFNGYNNFWWHRPYIGWNAWNWNWNWNMGWGYYGFNPYFGNPGFFGYGWSYFNNPYWYGGFGYPYWNNGFYYNNPYIYGRRGVAYNAGRRGSIYSNNNSRLSRRSSLVTSSGTRSVVRSNASTRTRGNTLSTQPSRPRNNTTRPNVNSAGPRPSSAGPRPNSSGSKPKVKTRSNTRSRSYSTPRSTRSNRSYRTPSSSGNRSYSSPNRSSGSSRSSGRR